MNTPALRLFAVFWWLLVLTTTGWEVFCLAQGNSPYTSATDEFGLFILAVLGPLPFIAMTSIRWIVTGRWCFGPRW